MHDSGLYNLKPLAFALDLHYRAVPPTLLYRVVCIRPTSPHLVKYVQKKNGGGSGLMKLTHYSLITLAVPTD